MNRLYITILFSTLLMAHRLNAQEAHINEFHYHNAGVDDNEFIEIAVQEGWQNAENLKVVLYEGTTGNVYAQYNLPSYSNPVLGGRLYVVLTPGIKNEMEGIALVDGNSVVEFISYGGTFTAQDGPAQGLQSKDVGVVETETSSATGSIYFSKNVWMLGDQENEATPGRLNHAQTALPVVLSSFDVSLNNRVVTINWSAAVEEDVLKYHIQSGTNGSTFTTIKTVSKSGEGKYSVMDNKVEHGVNFYRLEIEHVNGHKDYSQVLRVYNNNSNPNATLKILQNPVENNILYFTIVGFETIPTIQIIDAIGKVYGVTVRNMGEQRIDINNLAPGTYFLKAFDNTASKIIRFIK